MRLYSLIPFAASLALLGLRAQAEEPDFDPPASFREIDFVTSGGGPVAHYIAKEFAKIERVFGDPEKRIIWTTANPPTVATRTEVGGLFLLEFKDGKWAITDSLRFETSGKYSSALCELASDNEDPPYLKITLHKGGRGASHEEAVTYTLKDGKFTLALPKATR